MLMISPEKVNRLMIIDDFDQGKDYIEGMVKKILMECDITTPPVDVKAVAKKKGLVLTESMLEGRRGQNFIFRGKKFIEIDIRDRKVRQNFTIAHEILEVDLGEIVADPTERHKLATLWSPFLLMPSNWFQETCIEHNFDILKVKKAFDNVSHEAVALHMLHFAPAIITVFDNDRVTNRRSSYSFNVSRKLMSLEQGVIDQVLSSGEKFQTERDGVEVAAFPVFEEEFKRVIMRTQLDEFAQ